MEVEDIKAAAAAANAAVANHEAMIHPEKKELKPPAFAQPPLALASQGRHRRGGGGRHRNATFSRPGGKDQHGPKALWQRAAPVNQQQAGGAATAARAE